MWHPSAPAPVMAESVLKTVFSQTPWVPDSWVDLGALWEEATVEIVGLIAIYSTLVLSFLTLLGGSLVLVSKWLLDNSLDPDAH